MGLPLNGHDDSDGSLAMQPAYRIGRITAAEIDRAYLLVRLVAPELELVDWRARCRAVPTGSRHAHGQDDILVALSPAGYVKGLCVHALGTHPDHGRLLDVSIFVVASAADEGGITAGLLDHLKHSARREACQAIRIRTSGQDNWTRHIGDGDACADRGILILIEPRSVADA